MRLERLDGEESSRTIGAVVVRGGNTGDVIVELGPADGPPVMRLWLSHAESMRLAATLQGVAKSGGESVLIVDD